MWCCRGSRPDRIHRRRVPVGGRRSRGNRARINRGGPIVHSAIRRCTCHYNRADSRLSRGSRGGSSPFPFHRIPRPRTGREPGRRNSDRYCTHRNKAARPRGGTASGICQNRGFPSWSSLCLSWSWLCPSSRDAGGRAAADNPYRRNRHSNRRSIAAGNSHRGAFRCIPFAPGPIFDSGGPSTTCSVRYMGRGSSSGIGARGRLPNYRRLFAIVRAGRCSPNPARGNSNLRLRCNHC